MSISFHVNPRTGKKSLFFPKYPVKLFLLISSLSPNPHFTLVEQSILNFFLKDNTLFSYYSDRDAEWKRFLWYNNPMSIDNSHYPEEFKNPETFILKIGIYKNDTVEKYGVTFLVDILQNPTNGNLFVLISSYQLVWNEENKDNDPVSEYTDITVRERKIIQDCKNHDSKLLEKAILMTLNKIERDAIVSTSVLRYVPRAAGGQFVGEIERRLAEFGGIDPDFATKNMFVKPNAAGGGGAAGGGAAGGGAAGGGAAGRGAAGGGAAVERAAEAKKEREEKDEEGRIERFEKDCSIM